MPAKIPTATLRSARSHFVTLGHGGPPAEKEEVYLTFVAEWRGTRVIIEVQCERQSTGGYRWDNATVPVTMGDWRVFAHTPKEWPEGNEEYRYGDDCTATARDRLAVVVEPLATAWLASPAYVESSRQAYGYALLRQLADVRHAAHEPTASVRRQIAAYRDEITDAAHAALITACDARDAYAVAYATANETIIDRF